MASTPANNILFRAGRPPAREARPVRSGVARDKTTDIIFWICALGLIVRNLLNPNVINKFYPYSLPGGSIIFKIHPGSYLIIAASALAMLHILKFGLRDRSMPIWGSLLLLASIFFVLAFGMIINQSSNISYLIDSMAIAPLAILTLTIFSPAGKMALLRIGIIVVTVNAGFTLLQFVTRSHILPYPTYLTNGIFRPGGLTGHPLLVGLLTISCIPLLPLARYAFWKTAIITGIWSLAIVVTSSRVATAALPVVLGLTLLVVSQQAIRNGRLKVAEIGMLLPFAFLFFAIVLAIAYSAGLLDRVLIGFADDSAQARLDVYGIFEFLTEKEFLFGANLDIMQYYLLEFFGLEYIESPVVLYIINFGLIGAVVFGASLFIFFALMAIEFNILVRISTLTFLLIASTNNTLAVKGPTPLLVSSMLYLAGTLGAKRPARSNRRKPVRSERLHRPARQSGDQPDPFSRTGSRDQSLQE